MECPIECDSGIVSVREVVDAIRSVYDRSITVPTRYTVAAHGEDPSGYDYPDLETALTSIGGMQFLPAGIVELRLAPGEHRLMRNPNQPDWSGNTMPAYFFQHTTVMLTGTGETKADTQIVFDPDLEISGGMIVRMLSAKLSLTHLTVDLTKYHEDTPFSGTVFGGDYGYVYLDDMDLIGGGAGTVFYGWAPMKIYTQSSSAISGFHSYGTFLGGASIMDASQKSSITNAPFVIDTMIIRNLGEECFDLDAGEVSELGSATYSGKPLRFGGWSGPSADRPELGDDPSAQPYFDTDLQKPVWWTGAKWVDSAGAEV